MAIIVREAQPVCMDIDIQSVRMIRQSPAGKYIIDTESGDLVVEDCPLDVINAIIECYRAPISPASTGKGADHE